MPSTDRLSCCLIVITIVVVVVVLLFWIFINIHTRYYVYYRLTVFLLLRVMNRLLLLSSSLLLPFWPSHLHWTLFRWCCAIVGFFFCTENTTYPQCAINRFQIELNWIELNWIETNRIVSSHQTILRNFIGKTTPAYICTRSRITKSHEHILRIHIDRRKTNKQTTTVNDWI